MSKEVDRALAALEVLLDCRSNTRRLRGSGPRMEDALVIEYGAVAQRLLPRNTDEDIACDVIVVGSGAGGGLVASALADEGANVLVLEAGSLLFPTHVGNLPRSLPIGQFDKNTWHLWRDFGVINYRNVADSEFRGAQGFNLGGRSIFWGGLTPRLTTWQLEAWPPTVREFLLDAGGYETAEARLSSARAAPAAFKRQAVDFLDATLPGWAAADAPMAIQYVAPAHWCCRWASFPRRTCCSRMPCVPGALRRPEG